MPKEVDPLHSQPDLAAVTIPEIEEHRHIGALEAGAAYKSIHGAPVAYKSFPSLTVDVTYHALSTPGAASGATQWRVMRENKVTGTIEWAGGVADWVNNLDDVTNLSYS